MLICVWLIQCVSVLRLCSGCFFVLQCCIWHVNMNINFYLHSIRMFEIAILFWLVFWFDKRTTIRYLIAAVILTILQSTHHFIIVKTTITALRILPLWSCFNTIQFSEKRCFNTITLCHFQFLHIISNPRSSQNFLTYPKAAIICRSVSSWYRTFGILKLNIKINLLIQVCSVTSITFQIQNCKMVVYLRSMAVIVAHFASFAFATEIADDHKLLKECFKCFVIFFWEKSILPIISTAGVNKYSKFEDLFVCGFKKHFQIFKKVKFVLAILSKQNQKRFFIVTDFELSIDFAKFGMIFNFSNPNNPCRYLFFRSLILKWKIAHLVFFLGFFKINQIRTKINSNVFKIS